MRSTCLRPMRRPAEPNQPCLHCPSCESPNEPKPMLASERAAKVWWLELRVFFGLGFIGMDIPLVQVPSIKVSFLCFAWTVGMSVTVEGLCGTTRELMHAMWQLKAVRWEVAWFHGRSRRWRSLCQGRRSRHLGRGCCGEGRRGPRVASARFAKGPGLADACVPSRLWRFFSHNRRL